MAITTYWKIQTPDPAALGGVIVGTGLSVQTNGTISVNSTWLTQHVNAAVASYMTSNYQTGTTWGALANGFTQDKA